MILNYNELIKLETFEERFEYLKLKGRVGSSTFGFDRYLNQMFYRSRIWKSLRDQVIIRDNGLDLGCDGYAIFDKVIVHHMNPIDIEDIEEESDFLLNPIFLISTCNNTHQAIHYGSSDNLIKLPKERHAGDTKLW